MKDSKEMLKAELRNLNLRYTCIKNEEESDKHLRMFILFNLASKLEYKATEIGEIDLVFKITDLQTKIVDFITRSLRRKQE